MKLTCCQRLWRVVKHLPGDAYYRIFHGVRRWRFRETFPEDLKWRRADGSRVD